jgi:hypothetical protein
VAKINTGKDFISLNAANGGIHKDDLSSAERTGV